MVWPTNYLTCGIKKKSVMMTMTLPRILSMDKPCLTKGDKTICVQSFGALCNTGLSIAD